MAGHHYSIGKDVIPVIKIESPRGDDSRAYPPFSKGISAYYANLNRNKKSLCLDLHDEKAKDVLRELIKISDVFKSLSAK